MAGKKNLIGKMTDQLVKYPGKYFATDEGIAKYGLKNIMRWGRMYNDFRYGDRKRQHLAAYNSEATKLLEENSPTPWQPSGSQLQDGWLLDTSNSLPHLDALLAQAAEVIEMRGGRLHSDVQAPFLRSLLFPGDIEKFPAFLDFILSSEVLEIAMAHLKTVPMLSKTRPPGVRFMESNRKLDPFADQPPRASQLYHRDMYDAPMVYVLVALEDITSDCGPWTFLPAGTSARLTEELAYQEKGTGYRIEDKAIRPLINQGDEIVFAYPKGSVLFIDSSQCLHFGSRDAKTPRYLMMYGLTTSSRRDFSMAFMNPINYQINEGDSRLRRMVLE